MEENTVPGAQSAILRPSGDVVADSEADLRSKLRVLVASGIRKLTIDLSNVQMMDSAGLGLLIAAHNSLRKNGGELTVIHATHDLLELFRTMRMHQHFSISGE